MDKWKLIEITLNQLAKQWEHNKPLFESDDYDEQDPTLKTDREPYVSWKPPENIEGEQQQHSLIKKSVTISYCASGRYFKCTIKSTDTKLPAANRNDVCIIARKSFIPMRNMYWNFMKLRKQIRQHKKTLEHNAYLDNLCKIFPGTLDNYILGDDND